MSTRRVRFNEPGEVLERFVKGDDVLRLHELDEVRVAPFASRERGCPTW